MKIGIIGSGTVAQTLGEKLLLLGHEIMISSRNLDAEKESPSGRILSPNDWKAKMAKQGFKVGAGSFAEAAAYGAMIINATAGAGSLEALTAAGVENLKNKVIVDVANPLDFSKEADTASPPTLLICNTTSLGEQIQAAFPESFVVKTLNTVAARLMVEPTRVRGDHDLFICGNDAKAKLMVHEKILQRMGWKNVIDLGDITGARATEMYFPLWFRLYGVTNTLNFNIRIRT